MDLGVALGDRTHVAYQIVDGTAEDAGYGFAPWTLIFLEVPRSI
jgi:hypothetical protein